MVDYRSALENAIRAGACKLLSIPDAIDNLLDIPESDYNILGHLDNFTDSARGFYRKLICPSSADNPYDGLPDPSFPPPAGGQCPGVDYIVEATAKVAFYRRGVDEPEEYEAYYRSRPGPSSVVIMQGPLGDFVKPFQRTGGIRLYGPPLVLNDGSSSGQTGFEAIGNSVNTTNRTGGNNEIISAVITSVTRIDGQPDVCEEQITPPPFINDPISYEGPEGDNVVVSPKISFNPVVISPSGKLTIPVNILLNNNNLDANFNLNTGDISFELGGGDSDKSDCCLPPQLPEEPPMEDDDPPPPEEETIIQGVVVVCSLNSDLRATEVAQENIPDLYFPDLGSVVFRVKLGNSFFWLAPQKINLRRQFVICPWERGAVSVRVSQRSGVNISHKPVYASIRALKENGR